jgi:hypothetical protein
MSDDPSLVKSGAEFGHALLLGFPAGPRSSHLRGPCDRTYLAS